METNKLKRFATEARKVLLQGVTQRLTALGFNSDGTAEEEPQLYGGGAAFRGRIETVDFHTKWKALQHNIGARSFNEVVEEAAYTWFNRLTAIQILSKNEFVSNVLDYEAEDIRVPLIVSEARQGRLPQMDVETLEKVNALLQDDSQTNEQFRALLVEFCHATPIVEKCFGRIADYTELLLPQNILSEGGFVDMLNHTEFVSEDDWRSPELIGWLYQFYNAERKDEVFKKGGRVKADEIPAATQIFTPNWIVKYMVQNTVGRIYLDNNPSETDAFKAKWQYLVEPSEPTPSEAVCRYEDLTELKLADLACGSGHILNEFFELLFDLYKHEGYSTQNAIRSIFTHNIIGIDIDSRAKQLATFALLLKACQKDRSFVSAQCMPRIYDMPEPWEDKSALSGVLRKFIQGQDERAVGELYSAIKLMDNADSLGSIMKFNISERTRNIIAARMEEYSKVVFVPKEVRGLFPYMNIILALTDKYSALVMNPPYMGSAKMNAVLGEYVTNNYTIGKSDLFATFMLLAIERLAEKGKCGMITMQSWMFQPAYEQLRKGLLVNYHIENMLHLGARTFDEISGEVVQNTAFVICKNELVNGIYYYLVNGKDCADKESIFLSGQGCYPNISQHNFMKLDGMPVSYWVSEQLLNCIVENPSLGEVAEPRPGLQTSDNNRFLRFWFEVSLNKIGFEQKREEALKSEYKWFGHNKGGSERRWYGNNTYVINFQHDGQELKYWLEHNPNDPTTKSWSRNLRNYPFYFKEGLTWGAISSNKITVRYSPLGFTFDTSGPMIFIDNNLYYLLGLMNSKAFYDFAKLFSQGLSIGSGHIAKVPFIVKNKEAISNIVEDCVKISKADWDAHETSWDFINPGFKTNYVVWLRQNIGDPTCTINGEEIKGVGGFTIKTFVDIYKTNWETKFHKLHDNEEELNRQFIEIYGLQDELTPEVPMDEITILQQGEISIVGGEIQWHDDVIAKQLLSYAVGCMMGRYSIDRDGLILANAGDGIKEYEKLVPNSRFEVDEDAIIPLMPSNTYFTDNAKVRFRNWLAITFGSENLDENWNYIESCLGKPIDEYFVKDFWNDHKRMYQNRPIYWLFASEKKAFQCVVYMHRMNAWTVERMRSKYLLPYMQWLSDRQNALKANAANLTNSERRELDNIANQIEECREYHDRLHVVADQQIAIDLDDGVVVNYAKFGGVLAKIR